MAVVTLPLHCLGEVLQEVSRTNFSGFLAALTVAFVAMFPHPLLGQSEAVSKAVTAMQRGDWSSAERMLQSDLQSRPRDVEALDVLGVVLDKEKKYFEADEIYQRAIRLPQPSPGLLNNYGNHLLACGKLKEARKVFLRVISLDRGQVNAHVQLARISLEEKSASAALSYLDQILVEGPEQTVALLRMKALYMLERNHQANVIFENLSSEATQDVHLSFQLGLALAAVKRYEQAETFFSRAADAAPADVEVLHNLGVAASHSNHNDRARQVLEAALDREPENVDVLYELAVVNVKLNQKDRAVQGLVHASQLAPGRADVQFLLARTTADLGYYGDAVQAWNRYMSIEPEDDAGRRERGFAQAALGVDGKSAIEDLEWFLHRHPDDPVGHFELGMALSANDRAGALAQFDRTLVLKPDFAPALVARAIVNLHGDKPAAALPDLKLAAQREPEDARILDRLGQAYLALDRASDAERVLRKSLEVAPQDPTTLMHLSRALIKNGKSEEARTVTTRFRELGSTRGNVAHPAGLVQFLSLSPQEQYAQYRAGVERTLHSNPANVAAQVQYLKILLDDGRIDEASATTRRILELKPGLDLLSDAGTSLIQAQQFAVGATFLEQAISIAGSAADLRLNQAIAISYVTGFSAGLLLLDAMPDLQRTADYFVARAGMLDRARRSDEAISALRKGLQGTLSRPDLYQHAAFILLKNNHTEEAKHLLNKAANVLPENPELLLMQASAIELEKRTAEAESLLKVIENRWPDWSKVWIAHGIILDAHKRYEQASPMLEIGLAFGERSPAGYFCLADALFHSSTPHVEEAETAIRHAIELQPQDSEVRALAGRIAFAKHEYATAIDELREAVRLRPQSITAHQDLAQTYAKLGREKEAEQEMGRAAEMRRENSSEVAPYTANMLESLFQGKLAQP